MRSTQTVALVSVFLIGIGGCSTAPESASLPYIAHYRPLQPQPGEMVVSGTAELAGELSISGGCIAIRPSYGPVRLVAFPSHVAVTADGNDFGLVDEQSGARARVGDHIRVGGSAPPDPGRFAAERLLSPAPATCPSVVFLSNSGFTRF